MHQARLQVEDFSAQRLLIRDIKCLLLSKGLGTAGDSTIESVYNRKVLYLDR